MPNRFSRFCSCRGPGQQCKGKLHGHRNVLREHGDFGRLRSWKALAVMHSVSYDSLLVHYPDVVNLNDTYLSNCTSVIAMFENVISELMFNFNDTETLEARANADAMIPSMNSAFGLTFIHNSTTLYFTTLPIHNRNLHCRRQTRYAGFSRNDQNPMC